MSDRICKIMGCTGKVHARGVCKNHHQNMIRMGTLKKVRKVPTVQRFCIKEGCSEEYAAKGFCEKHYQEYKVQTNPEKYKKIELARLHRTRNRKKEIIKEKGGQCTLCGYNKNLAALEFHHPDPSIKEHTPGKALRIKDFEIARHELEKCIVVCKNCHAELHHSNLFNWNDSTNEIDAARPSGEPEVTTSP